MEARQTVTDVDVIAAAKSLNIELTEEQVQGVINAWHLIPPAERLTWRHDQDPVRRVASVVGVSNVISDT